MDKQEVFDFVFKFLWEQNKPSTKKRHDDGGESCAYRGANGEMCAVGCLIHDTEYDPGLEGAVCSHFAVVEALERSGINQTNINLLRLCQGAHDSFVVEAYRDGVNFREHLVHNFSNIAFHEGLSSAIIVEYALNESSNVY